MRNFKESGRVGQKRFGGIFYEEFLQELQGRKGIETYREMSENDDVIGAVLYAIEMLIRQVEWNTQPGGGGQSAADIEAARFVWECMNDMMDTWNDTVSEILSMLIYGWSAHEIVYKRRCGRKKDSRLNSKYNDGLIGWKGLPIRSQETLYEWQIDSQDNVTAMIQMPPPDYGMISIPIEKLLLFRTKSRKANPEGRSILRNAYRSWYFKKRIQEIEGIGIERDLAGLPTLTPPEGVDIWNSEDPQMTEQLARAEKIVTQIKRDSLEGVVIPPGWTLELLTTGGQRQFDTNAIIERYDSRMAMTVLADFILLGHQKVGTFALSSDKSRLFASAVNAYLDMIVEVFNKKAIPDLIDINCEHFSGITDYPILTHAGVDDVDLAAIGTFIKDLVGAGILSPDDNLEDHLRDVAHLPERIEEG